MFSPEDMTKFTKNEVVNMYGELSQNLSKSIISKLKSNGDISSYTRQQIVNLRQIRRKTSIF